MRSSEEVWKPIRGFENSYMISNKGRVKSLDRFIIKSDGKRQTFKGRILKLRRDKYGYLRISFHMGQDVKTFSIHKLVAIAFIGDPPSSTHHVNHKNGIKTDNDVSNLEYCTPKENNIHAFSIGLMSGRKGSSHHNCKLTDDDVREIRYKLKDVSSRYLSEKYGVSVSMINNIKSKRSWTHI
jgi:hypothetical protein